MIITDEILNAYLDGELTVEEIAEVATQIEKSPELIKRVETMRQYDKTIVRTYHAIDTKPMPDSIMAMLENFPENQKTVLPFKKKPTAPIRSPKWQMAMAASIALFIGFGAGQTLMAPSSETATSAENIMVQQNSGIIGPDNILFSALENHPSATPFTILAGNDTTVIPAMTFRTADNGYCREYSVISQKSSTQNVACRVENTWLLKLSVGTAGQSPSENGLYQTASHLYNPAINSIIQNLIVGDALSADDEAQVMKQNWHQ